MEIQKESEGYDTSRGMIISIDTVTQVSIEIREQKELNKNIGINIEQNANNTYEYADKCV